MKDAVLQNSEFVNFGGRASATITQVTHFLTRCILIPQRQTYKMLTLWSLWYSICLCLRFPVLLNYSSAAELNEIEDEFLEYQFMRESDIPEHVWQSAPVVDKETRHHRMVSHEVNETP